MMTMVVILDMMYTGREHKKSGWCDHHKIIVWTQYQKDVSVGSGGYDDDGCYLGYDVHWVIAYFVNIFNNRTF